MAQKKFVSHFQGHKSKVTVLAGMVPPGGSEGESVACPCPSFWRPSAVLAGLWFVDASFQSLCPCLQRAFPSVLSLSYKVTVMRWEARPSPGWSHDHINSELPTETLFPSRVTFTGSQETCFCGTLFNPLKLPKEILG